MLERLFDGRLWPVPGFEFQSFTNVDDVPGDGAIVVIPARYHVEDWNRINEIISRWRWVVLMLVGDEESAFPYAKINHPNIRFWIMDPRPEFDYPADTVFIGSGWAKDAPDVLDAISGTPERMWDWFFAGQVTHDRRKECVAHIRDIPNGFLLETDGFTKGLALGEYLYRMRHSKVVPCPSGPCSQDSFRAFEALEAGCVPILDGTRLDGGGRGFWKMVLGDMSKGFVLEHSWGGAPAFIEGVLGNWLFSANTAFADWQRYKRSLAYRLHDHLVALKVPESKLSNGRDDEITVIVPVSPIPSHPSTEILDETLDSIRRQLPRAEIIVMFDGVREEQADRGADYYEFVNRALHDMNSNQTAVFPFFHWWHLHQGLMTKAALDYVRTPTILFVEQDTPLVGEIPWGDMVEVVESGFLNVVRLHHEAEIHPEHEHLMLDAGPVDLMGLPVRRTAQWSQRPHLASTEFYDRMLEAYIGARARTMIEDVVYGPCTLGINGKAAWSWWRTAIYSPEGDMKRSLHTDGRAGDVKYPMVFDYDGPVPLNAPQPTVKS
jgi:hypothetical protein